MQPSLQIELSDCQTSKANFYRAGRNIYLYFIHTRLHYFE